MALALAATGNCEAAQDPSLHPSTKHTNRKTASPSQALYHASNQQQANQACVSQMLSILGLHFGGAAPPFPAPPPAFVFIPSIYASMPARHYLQSIHPSTHQTSKEPTNQETQTTQPGVFSKHCCPPPVKQVTPGTCTDNDVTSCLFHTACLRLPNCQTFCFHLNSFLLQTLLNPPATTQRLSGAAFLN